MLSLYKILTVARYEMKTLLRSWFFRIFSILAILFLILLNIGMHTNVGRTPWFMNGLNASLPYMDILLLNVAQAIIGVFLASDFLKRDKKLDTTEVIYMRSMTNGDYVLGKTLGILFVFLGLNIVVLVISAIFHIFFSSATFTIVPYFLYPLVISLPTLLFIFGLSFLFMVTIRNQAVTFILLLGYIALTLFFLGQKLHYVFDYMAFNVPLMYSDFVGFGQLSVIFVHRGIYFLLGLAFIFATIFMIKRLPQSSAMTRFSAIFSVASIIGAGALAFVYLSGFSKAADLRQEIRNLSQQYLNSATVQPVRYDVILTHKGSKIDVKANLVFKNNTDKAIDNYIFTLNPGLKVKSVQSQSGDIDFTRKLHLIIVRPLIPLAAGATDSLTISYSGAINEDATYLDSDEKKRQELYKLWLYKVAKKVAFIKSDYVLLTPESFWYPIAGLPTSLTFPQKINKNFFTFNLNVKTNPKYTAISQGKMTDDGKGNFSFVCDHPLPQRSLVIGDYSQKSITVDSVDYRLYYLESHDYFSSYFTEIGDTLAALIRETKQDYENKIGLEYIFPRFYLIEVPIQFFYYPHIWTVSDEVIQPEMALVHEKGVLMKGADISNQFRWQQRWRQRSNQTITPLEQQSDIFTRFLRSALFNSGFRRMFFEEGMLNLRPDYHVFSNYFNFVNNFASADVPIFNVALESYLSQKTQPASSGFRRLFMGLSDEEKANIELMEKSLKEIFDDPEKKDILSSVLSQKGQYLFKYIQSQITTEEFDTFISDFLKQHRFENVDVELFVHELSRITSFDLMPFFQKWYNEKKLPAFLITDIDAYKIIDNDRTRFQIKFKAENYEDIDGLISVTFRMAGRRGRFFGMGGSAEEPEEKLIRMNPGEIKEIGIVLDDEPRVLNINTLISKNLPTTITRRLEELELNKKAIAFDGVRNLSNHLKWTEPNEIVVDNEDDGFAVYEPENRSFLKKLFSSEKENEEKYIGITFWRPPKHWRATTNADFFGKFIHSAYYTKSGDGDKKAIWKTQIHSAGQYDIYYYASSLSVPWRRRDGKRRNDITQDFHFLIYHDDGTEEIVVDMSDIETGWALLGTYYLSEGEAKVELSNKSKGRIVFADAVKWVKH